jgi:hypothetical protein
MRRAFFSARVFMWQIIETGIALKAFTSFFHKFTLEQTVALL